MEDEGRQEGISPSPCSGTVDSPPDFRPSSAIFLVQEAAWDVAGTTLLARISKARQARNAGTAQQWIGWTALLAVAYVLAGRMGQLLAVPPNYATVIWPPSGIALAAVLLIGPRAWPGILLGALIVNGWTPWFSAPSTWLGIKELVGPLSISLGATGQALLGGSLIRRFVGFPNPLIQDLHTVAFLFLGGPTACLLGSTWGVTTLAIEGKIQGLAPLALNWGTWWVGDVIGVLLFTPLLLIAFAQPRKLWRPRWISVSLPLTGAITVTIVGFMLTQHYGSQQSKMHFDRVAVNSHQFLNSQIERHLDAIDSLQRYLAFSPLINQSEFTAFAQDSSRQREAIKMIAWVPRDTRSLGPRGSANSEQADRFTVAYVHPETTPFFSPGMDFASQASWRKWMQQCLATGTQIASPPFLPDEHRSGGDRHVMVLAPVYRQGVALETLTQRQESLTGFLIGVIQIESLVASSTTPLDLANFSIRIEDVTERGSPHLVHETRLIPSPHKSSEVVQSLRREFEVPVITSFANRVWGCSYVPTAKFFSDMDNQQHWTLMTGGFSVTAILGAFLLILSGRTAQIETSEARYLDLYENAPDMFISLDVGSQRVIECNRTFLESTGFQKSQVLDKHMYELFDQASRTDAMQAFRNFLLTGHVSDMEMRLLCHDGKLVDISLKMSAVRDEDGECIVCRAALRDITARKRVESDLKAQEMELAHVGRLSMMGEMAAGLAHEINQPLAAIAAYAEGASIRLRDGKPDVNSLTVVLDRIARDAHRAGQVIRRLRQFLRKRNPERTTVRINDLVREVAQFVDADLRRREIRMGIDLGENLQTVQGDPIQIQQVLLNLVRNGCDAMIHTEPSRRNLMIRTRSHDGERVAVTVEDCGHGLAPNTNDQLFEAFYSTKDEGLGMGLAISRSIIESHGGQIWATSNLGGGASFHFSIPTTAEVCA